MDRGRHADDHCAWQLLIQERSEDFAILLRLCGARAGRPSLHVLATVARLVGLGGVRAVVAESVLVKQQLLILNRSRSVRHASVSVIAWSPASARCSCARADWSVSRSS